LTSVKFSNKMCSFILQAR